METAGRARKITIFVAIYAVIIVGIAGALLWFIFGRGPSTDDVAEYVRVEMQSYLRTDAKMSKYALEVREVHLVSASGNEYKGIAEVYWHRDREVHDVPITVVYDDGRGMWQAERGAFLFLARAPASDASR